MPGYVVGSEKLISMFYRFLAYTRCRDGDRVLSFVDGNSYLGREENYKSKVSELAHIELAYENWKETLVGSGKILRRAHRAMDRAGNLVNVNQKTQFKNIINPEHAKYRNDAERALYDICRSMPGDEEKAAFTQAKKVFGGHYDTMGFLFFAKDATRFLPVASDNFDRSLSSVGINYRLSGRCSWENYTGFIEIVRGVQVIMQDLLPGIDIRLIDAHSFLWIINERAFREWRPDAGIIAEIESSTENCLYAAASGNTSRRSRIAGYYTRSAEVSRETKERANGVCQLCGKSAPFNDRSGAPYLEAHHIIWLSRGGKDSTDNTVALCPNCHTKMHVLDDSGDVEALLKQVR